MNFLIQSQNFGSVPILFTKWGLALAEGIWVNLLWEYINTQTELHDTKSYK